MTKDDIIEEKFAIKYNLYICSQVISIFPNAMCVSMEMTGGMKWNWMKIITIKFNQY